MPYAVVLFSDYSMGLRSIFSIRTWPYFWCFKHLMGGASNPANQKNNPEKTTRPSVTGTGHTSFFEGFSSVGLICVKTIIIDYIRPVEFIGDILEILG